MTLFLRHARAHRASKRAFSVGLPANAVTTGLAEVIALWLVTLLDPIRASQTALSLTARVWQAGQV